MVRRRRSRQAISQQITEQCIESLKLLGFAPITFVEYDAMREQFVGNGERYLVKDHPYQTPYGTKGRGEWLVVSRELTAPLECKHQEGSGSVDEKLPYVVARCQNSEHLGLIIVFGGRYWTEHKRGMAAVAWLRKEADIIAHTNRKQLVVCETFGAFIAFAERTWK